VAQPEGWCFADGNPAHGHDVLATNGQVLVSQAFFDQAALEIGDRLRLSADRHDPTNGTIIGTIAENVTVGGVVSFLPGVPNGAGIVIPPLPNNIYYGPYQWAVYAGLGTIQRFLDPAVENFGTVNRYLVDLAPGTDWPALKAAAAAAGNVGSVEVTAEQVEAQNASPFVRAFAGFIGMEIAFIVVILTAGVGLIVGASDDVPSTRLVLQVHPAQLRRQ
jgi:hypothetical protein